MKYLKLNKFDKTKDLVWNKLGGFSQPMSRSSVIMSAYERAEFKELENKIRIPGNRATTQTESSIFIVEE